MRADKGVELKKGDGYSGLSEMAVCTEVNDQYTPKVLTDSKGNSIIVWQDYRSGYDIYAQRYDRDWSKNGSEFLLVTVVSGGTWGYDIAMDSKDGFILTWGGNQDIYAQRFEENGSKNGTAIPVCVMAQIQRNPTIGIDSNDNFLIVWEDFRNIANSDLYAQRYNADGNANGTNFDVTRTQYAQGDPTIATNSKDEYIIGYTNYTTALGGIYVERYNSKGNQLGNEIVVCATADYELYTAVTTDSNDNILVAWDEFVNTFPFVHNISARRMDASGNFIGNTIPVSMAAGNQSNPKIAARQGNNFIVSWMDDSRDGTCNVYGQQYDANGNKVGGEITMATGANAQDYPDIVIDSDDNLVVAWRDNRGGTWDVYAKKFVHPYDSSGTLVTGTILAPPNISGWANVTANLTWGNAAKNSISYEISTDNGLLWIPVPANGSLAAAASAPAIRIKVKLSTSDPLATPVLYNITVNCVLNRSPAVSVGSDLTVWRNTPVMLIANASDGDNDPLAYSWSQVGGPALSLGDTTSSILSFIPASSSVYRFRVVTNDGCNESPPALINVTVNNRPPSVTTTPNLTHWKGENVTLKVNSTDPDNDELAFTWTQISGNYSYFDTRDGPEVVFNAGIVGEFTFGVIACDGEENSTMTIVNLSIWSKAPVAILNITPQEIKTGGSVLFDASGSWDPDGIILGYKFDFGDSGTQEWQKARCMYHDYSIPGNYSVTVTVKDDDGNVSESQPAIIYVIKENVPPRITSVHPETAKVGEKYVYKMTAVDDDADALTFTLLSTIENMTINPNTGELVWIPDESQKGKNTVTVQVSDGKSGTAKQTFNITVTESALPPPPKEPKCFIASPLNDSKVSGRVKISGTAIAGNQTLKSIQVWVDDGSWQTATGLENWTFDIDTLKLKNGNHTIKARACDGIDYSETVTIKIPSVFG